MNEKNLNDGIKNRITQYLATSSKEELQKKCRFSFDSDSYYAYRGNAPLSGSYLTARVECEKLDFSCEVDVPVFADVRNMKEYLEQNKNELEKTALCRIIGGCIIESPRRNSNIK